MARSPVNALRYGCLLSVLSLAMPAALSADEVTDWHEHMLDVLFAANLRPPVSTREASFVSSAVFDAVNGVERRYEPIHVTDTAPKGTSKRAAAVQAAYRILSVRFATQSAALGLDAKRTASLAAIGDADSQSLQRGVAWGQFVADEILLWRSTDGFSTATSPYVGTEPGEWRPTPPTFGAGVFPHLATTTPWGIPSAIDFRAPGPPALDSAQYLADLEEVRLFGEIDSPLRTADQTDACRFARDTSGTYVWNRLAIDLAEDEGFELSENARLLARLNLSQADSVIACWDAKYHYLFWRPVTAIRLEDADEDEEPDDPDWTPLIVTPAHPEYSSGHSSVYGSAVTVLATYFGNDTPVVLQAQHDPAWIRAYPNFSAAIDEVALSRVYGGIHFRTACDDAVFASSAIATYIMQNRMQRVHGEGEDDE